jgi:2-polyprenyl-3-methyl-5-hydroxy-6-metoxy-1,4-benzoquinol methylase
LKHESRSEPLNHDDPTRGANIGTGEVTYDGKAQLNSREVRGLPKMLQTTTNTGLHAFVADRVVAGYAKAGMRAADLGTGPGAMAERLQAMGCEVVGADMSAEGFGAKLPHVVVNFDQPDFASQLGTKMFGLVTAIEVIEHVESPIGFLRNIGNLLAPGGVAVLTTPNVESLPARLKFLLNGKVRTMDKYGEPTHISPIFMDLLTRQFLKRTCLDLEQHYLFPPGRFQLTRQPIASVLSVAGRMLPGKFLLGDNHVWVFRAKA